MGDTIVMSTRKVAYDYIGHISILLRLPLSGIAAKHINIMKWYVSVRKCGGKNAAHVE